MYIYGASTTKYHVADTHDTPSSHFKMAEIGTCCFPGLRSRACLIGPVSVESDWVGVSCLWKPGLSLDQLQQIWPLLSYIAIQQIWPLLSYIAINCYCRT